MGQAAWAYLWKARPWGQKRGSGGSSEWGSLSQWSPRSATFLGSSVAKRRKMSLRFHLWGGRVQNARNGLKLLNFLGCQALWLPWVVLHHPPNPPPPLTDPSPLPWVAGVQGYKGVQPKFCLAVRVEGVAVGGGCHLWKGRLVHWWF